MSWIRGKVVGRGFIQLENGERAAIRDPALGARLEVNQQVECRVETSERGRLQAVDVRPVKVPAPRPRAEARQAGREPRLRAPAREYTIESLHDGTHVKFKGSDEKVPFKKFDVTDLLLAIRPGAIRPGAVFEKVGKSYRLLRFAHDVAQELPGGPEPNIDQNPYSFAAWAADRPSTADAPELAAHDREHPGRISGRIRITYTARTPVFVPAAEPSQSAFFTCWDGETERLAIPGSSLKGAVRALFEALTNSRAGVSDTTQLGSLDNRPELGRHLYRRRSTRLFLLETLPTSSAPGQVVELEWGYARRARGGRWDYAGPWATDPKTKVETPRAGFLHDPSSADERREWQANLFAVPHTQYEHKDEKTHIAFRKTTRTFGLTTSVLERYLGMRGHPHLTRHPDNVADTKESGSKKTGYRNNAAPPYDAAVESRLFTLVEGETLLYGVEKYGEICAFGRNVNFLWPAERSPAELAGPYLARSPARSSLAGSDPAELTFGFIGDESADAHSFRGRVRFTTFWGSSVNEHATFPVNLMPLASPAGAKAKSRPLYLEPRADTLSGDYSDHGAQLSGRKFYWHQRADDDRIPIQHDYDRLIRPEGPQLPAAYPPLAINPVKAGATFTGEVHFTNLTPIELGALLVALAPHLAFGECAGIKIGRGKPRGLGSVAAEEISLKTLTEPGKRYGSIDHPVEQGADPAESVAAYKQWAGEQAGSEWEEIGFVQDLAALLALPPETSPSVRVYPPSFDMYLWMPTFNNPNGEDEQHGRPHAMKRARDTKRAG